jgi:acetolactate decarboxylase
MRVVQVRRSDVAPDHRGEHHFFQVSTLDALIDRRFDGDMTLAELAAHGDHGIGTLNGLDGELVLVDGSFFQITVDGRAQEVPAKRLTPFALATFFAPDASEVLKGPATRDEVEVAVARLANSDDQASVAVRLIGTFPRIDARSAIPEEQPYRPFAEAVRSNQRKFSLADCEGVMFGFRFPESMEGVQIPGFHLHFVSADRASGGHILDYDAVDVQVEIQKATVLQIELPPGVDPAEPGLSAEDLRAIHGVEG